VKLTRSLFPREAAGYNSYSSSHAWELDKRAAYLQALERYSGHLERRTSPEGYNS